MRQLGIQSDNSAEWFVGLKTDEDDAIGRRTEVFSRERHTITFEGNGSNRTGNIKFTLIIRDFSFRPICIEIGNVKGS